MAMEEELIGSGQHFFCSGFMKTRGSPCMILPGWGILIRDCDKGSAEAIDLGYIRVETDSRDRRIRHLFVRESAVRHIHAIYEIREQWQELLFDGFSKEEERMVYVALKQMAERSCMALDDFTGKEQNERYDTCKTNTGRQS